LPENVLAWQLFCQMPMNQMTGGLDYEFLRFYFELYMNDDSLEEKQDLFEKLILVNRIFSEKKNA
jgi:hypothetical protein